MPREVQIVKSTDIETSTGQTEGMIRQGAIVDMSDKVCASSRVCCFSNNPYSLKPPSVMIAKPHSSSAVHHHGEQDTIVYAAAGHGTVVSEGGRKRQDLAPGDFALIPAFAEHQEVNDGDEQVTWIITRSGRVPIIENLGKWGTS